jgi:threonine dehydrogenase-like Zn-dependent dehydrogenase
VTEIAGPLEIQSLPLPDLEPGGILVRVDAATLCGLDVIIWRGGFGPPAGLLPYIPGHETVGTIVEIRGERRDLLNQPLAVGQRIIWTYPYCGHCFFCSVANQPTLCSNTVRFGRARADQAPYLLGGCAEFHYVPPACQIVPVPDAVEPALAASAACALRTVMHGFERLGVVKGHETVVVQGCGPIGLYATAVARDRGVGRLLVIGAPAARLEVARAWGADDTLDLEAVTDPAARREWVREQTGGRGADVVIQGAAAVAMAEALELVRRGGRILSIGGGGGHITIDAELLATEFIQITGVRGAEGRHYYEALNLLATRRQVPFEQLITGRYGLDGTTTALQAMADLREVKPAILPAGVA